MRFSVLIIFLCVLVVAETDSDAGAWTSWYFVSETRCMKTCYRGFVMGRLCEDGKTCLGKQYSSYYVNCTGDECNNPRGDWERWVNVSYPQDCNQECVGIMRHSRVCVPKNSCEGLFKWKETIKCTDCNFR